MRYVSQSWVFLYAFILLSANGGVGAHPFRIYTSFRGESTENLAATRLGQASLCRPLSSRKEENVSSFCSIPSLFFSRHLLFNALFLVCLFWVLKLNSELDHYWPVPYHPRLLPFLHPCRRTHHPAHPSSYIASCELRIIIIPSSRPLSPSSIFSCLPRVCQNFRSSQCWPHLRVRTSCRHCNITRRLYSVLFLLMSRVQQPSLLIINSSRLRARPLPFFSSSALLSSMFPFQPRTR